MSESDRDRIGRAEELLRAAYGLQMAGQVDQAILVYRQSLDCWPSAEAHTFLGWALSFKGDLDGAIEECKRAIRVDPDFGNPYNDIGSYLIARGELDEAIPWLEKAIAAKRYEPRHYPHCNLARVYWAQGQLLHAAAEFERALTIQPDYEFARQALEKLRGQLN